MKNVHSIFVTSLSFVDDSKEISAIVGDSDAAVVSVSADSSCQLTKLGSRGKQVIVHWVATNNDLSLWLNLLLCWFSLYRSTDCSSVWLKIFSLFFQLCFLSGW